MSTDTRRMTSRPMVMVRYGAMGRVGLFGAATVEPLRDEQVVVRTSRGVEIGQILACELNHNELSDGEAAGVLVRLATAGDLEFAAAADSRRTAVYNAVAKLAEHRQWPISVLEVEELVDPQCLVAHYLGAPVLDDRVQINLDGTPFDVIWEAASFDPFAVDESPRGGCCSSGGCGSCGDRRDSHTTHAGGCDGCAVATLLAARR